MNLLTVKEVCSNYKMCKATLYKRIGQRKFGTYKNGKKTLIDADEVERWLKKTRRESIPAGR